MAKDISRKVGITIGLDVSDRFTEGYAIDADGEWIENWRMPTKQGTLREGLSRYLELGWCSRWAATRPGSVGSSSKRASRSSWPTRGRARIAVSGVTCMNPLQS